MMLTDALRVEEGFCQVSSNFLSINRFPSLFWASPLRTPQILNLPETVYRKEGKDAREATYTCDSSRSGSFLHFGT